MLAKLYDLLVRLPARTLGNLESLLMLGLRLWVAEAFLVSGWLKITNWTGTVFLFENEYRVPVLPPYLAAVAGTFGELAFPVLLVVGAAGRLSALGLFAVNAMAVISYAHVLLTEGFEAAVAQHYLWGLALLVLAVVGPGRFSLDGVLAARAAAPAAASLRARVAA